MLGKSRFLASLGMTSCGGGDGRATGCCGWRPSPRTLFGFGDYAAGDACRSAWGAAFGGVNDQSGAAVAEDGVIFAAHGYVGGDDGDVRGVVCADDEEKIGDVAGGHALVAVACGIEVRTGALKIRRVAFGNLVDVHGVLAWRKILDVE